MPDHALELSFTAASDEACRAQWEALRAAGLPSQADHKSMTNAPHLTWVAASPVPIEVRALGRDVVLPLLPLELPVRGLVILGEGPRVTLAHLIEPDAALVEAVAALRAATPSVRHPLWTPHLTLARRLPRHRLPEALEVFAGCTPLRSVTADRLRWWDPDSGVVETL